MKIFEIAPARYTRSIHVREKSCTGYIRHFLQVERVSNMNIDVENIKRTHLRYK